MSELLGFDLPASVAEPAPQNPLPSNSGKKRARRFTNISEIPGSLVPSSGSEVLVQVAQIPDSNKLLSMYGIASRRAADQLLTQDASRSTSAS